MNTRTMLNYMLICKFNLIDWSCFNFTIFLFVKKNFIHTYSKTTKGFNKVLVFTDLETLKQ